MREHWNEGADDEKGAEERARQTEGGERNTPSQESPDAVRGQRRVSETDGGGRRGAESVEPVEDEAGRESDAEQLRQYLKERYDSEAEVAQEDAPAQERTEDQRDIENETHASQEPTEAQRPESAETEANGEPAGETDPARVRENDANDSENLEPPDPKDDSADELDEKPAADSRVAREDGKEAPAETPQTAVDPEIEATQPEGENRTEPPQEAQAEGDEKVGIGQEAVRETPQRISEEVAEPTHVEARDQSDPPESSAIEAARENVDAAQPKEESKAGESVNSFGESDDAERTSTLTPEVDSDGVDPSAVSLRIEAESTTATAGTDASDDRNELTTPIAEADGRENLSAEKSFNQEFSVDDASIYQPEAIKASQGGGLDGNIEPQHKEQVAHKPYAVENPSQRENQFPASSEPEHVGRGTEHEPTRQPFDRQLEARKEPAEAPEQPLAIIPLKAYRVPGEKEDVRFDMHTSSFEKSTRTRFEKGKVYRVNWGIDGIGDFEKVYRGQSDHFVLFVPREQSEKVTPGERYAIRVDSVEERRTFVVTSANGYDKLKITRVDLESAGLDGKRATNGKVAQLELRNLSMKEDEPTTLFATTERKSGGVNLSVDRVGGRESDVIELVRAREYGVDEFLRDFDKNKGREFEDVRLQLNGSKLSMEVDGERFPFREYRLSAYQLDAFLKTRLQGGSELSRLRYGDGKSASGDSSLFFRYSAIDDRCRIVHTVGKHQYEVSQLRLRQGGALEELPERIDKKQILESLKLIDRPESTEGSYLFNVDKILSETIQSRLDFARETSGYSHERGNIAEEVCVTILEMDGWREVKRHPFAIRITGESNEHGPDSLMQRAVSENLALFEYKWWTNVKEAERDASDQLTGFTAYRNESRYGRISGAFMGILDWRPENTDGTLYVKRAWLSD